MDKVDLSGLLTFRTGPRRPVDSNPGPSFCEATVLEDGYCNCSVELSIKMCHEKSNSCF